MISGITFEKQIEEALYSLSIEAKQESQGPKGRPKQTVIVIAGPTGCGKSDFAMMLAKAINGEILAADSMQVYREMDIGTAKPTKADRAQIPHHLIDIRDVSDPINVVDYYHEACFCLHTIEDRETIPIVVGGSGFYLHTLIYGPPSGPPACPDIRQKLEEEIKRVGSDALYERLNERDPVYAKTLTSHDWHKIIRGLEIIELTGKKVSSLEWKQRCPPKKYDFRCWFLHRPRDHLYHRIERRCDKMVEKGLLDEVIRLESKGLRNNSSASQAIGYRQALEFLDSEQTHKDYHYFLESFKQKSRQYAKRQMTWFRQQESLYQWIDIDAHDFETAIEIIIQDLRAR